MCNIIARAFRIGFGTAMAIAAVAGFAATTTPPDACSAPAAAPKLASQAQHYSLKSNRLYTPRFPVMGLSLKARIDGGPTLRLLLDRYSLPPGANFSFAAKLRHKRHLTDRVPHGTGRQNCEWILKPES